MSNKNMREIDTETPVIWPAWCYTGEASIDDTTHSISTGQRTTRSPLTTSGSGGGGSVVSGLLNNKIKGKRKTIFPNSIDKMLSDRMMNITENRKYCDSSTNNLFYDNKNKCEISMDVIRNDDTMTVNNNNNIKTERLSPQNGDILTSNSRSRSATPSSYPGTPPQSMNSSDNLITNSSSGILSGSSMKSDFQPRNYSDFIRSLAAKYNNTNPNEPNNSRQYFEPNKFNLNTSKPTAKEPQSSPESKRLQTTAPQVPTQSTLMSSIFPGIPFPTAVFSPLIDMSSTQALVTLARAAKEAELQTLLKNNPKKSPELSPLSNQNQNNSNTSNNLTSTTPHSSRFQSQSSFLNTSITNLNQHHNHHRTPRSPSTVAATSSEQQTTTPLDLSAAPVTKRLKLESPSPSRSIESPVSQHRSKVTSQRKCQSQCEEINSWSVDQVCDFVSSIDICAEYTENFREQRIDGTGLPLLTEDHLMNSLGMKLGPALKLRSVLARKSGGPCPCVACSLTITAQSPAGSMPRPSSVDSETGTKLRNLSGATLTDEHRITYFNMKMFGVTFFTIF